ncbi:MAG: DNA-protecting protein DprA [Saprospiraceae bacterium]|nr:DNA-protecting protein DprA [Saprospiraceae bacterium]
MSDPALVYKIGLTQIPLVGAVLARNLVSYCGSVEAVFAEKRQHLLKIPGIGPTTADAIVHKQYWNVVESELAFVQEKDVKVLFYLDDDYPYRLQRIKDAPILMYARGNLDCNVQRTVGIVGTRRPTTYGKIQCEKIVDSLRDLDVLIVSGLAYGIDATAHKKALDVGLPTVGILGSGFSNIYPAAHKRLAREMLLDGGIMTEFKHDSLPDREHFPMRNRVIAGLSDALVVVESDSRGGSMITAELANGYHKDVFAIPGRIGDQWSRGCNDLIKSNKAHLLDGGTALAEYMQWTVEEPPSIQRRLFADLDENESKICALLRESSPVSIDKLYNSFNLSASEMASLLLGLEFKGIIKALPGKLYMIV